MEKTQVIEFRNYRQYFAINILQGGIRLFENRIRKSARFLLKNV